MFGTIFYFELKRWFKSWLFYLYIAIFFSICFLAMASSIGVFDSVKNTTASLIHKNSPLILNSLIDSFNILLYFLFPSIIGASVYRDYKYNVHHILYSYPFSKLDYLLGKFLSSFLVTLCITLMMGVGAYLATLLPWANEQLLGENHIWNYLQVYIFNIIPNMLFIGSIVFVVVTLSRSIYVGFVTILILIIFQGLVNGMASEIDNRELAALIDPGANQAIRYYAQYWTVNDINNNNLPLEKWYLLNRVIWLGVSILFLVILSKVFSFTQQAYTFSWRKKVKGERVTKNNFIGIFKIELPKVNYDYSTLRNWKNVFAFAKFDFKYLAKNKVFMILISVGILFMILVSGAAMSMYGTSTLPVTREMLAIPGQTFELFILIVTFLGAGLLIHRAQLANMNLLVDATETPNWVFFVSKFLALTLLQLVLLLSIVITGVLIQSYNGFYDFEIGLYFKYLLGISFLPYLIWTLMSMAVQTLFKNYIIGFLFLVVLMIAWPSLRAAGIEQLVFFFNKSPKPSYSDLDGFGTGLARYYIFSFYWLLFVLFLGGLTLLFWRRGVFTGLKDRFYFAKRRAIPSIVIPTVVFLLGFIALGSYLYYENTVLNEYTSDKDTELQRVEYERQYKKYEKMILPRIVDVKVDLDLYPERNDFQARGTYILKNKTNQSIDSLLISYQSSYKNSIEIESATYLSKDSVNGFMFFKMNKPLEAGDSIQLNFVVENKPNTLLRSNSPVLGNGTFINNGIFPSLGYSANGEFSNDEIRKKYGLAPKERMAKQTDVEALQNTYIASDSDWITFETTVSTSKDQIAIAPGYLQKEWVEGNQRYFHYKMDQKMLNFYAYNSAKYEVKKDKWNDINIEIYYHKDHPYNIDRMINGVKKSLAYYTKEFSPYQHKQVRIIEFPNTIGSFAQSFANTIPFSETIGFIADVDEENDNSVDYPFSVTSHEIAHQWWAHQVIGANVQGATMLSESLAEYSSLKVLEAEYGKGQMRRFLKDALDGYLRGRRGESKKEKPLMYNENQQYIHYNKGSLVFYALSDYIGDDKLNGVLKEYIKKVAFQEAPFTIAAELVEDIKKATPDSLQYMIKDMFETITLYDNYVENVEVKELDNGKFEVKIKAIISKYQADDKGEKLFVNSDGNSLSYKDKKGEEINSLPLADYIEIGIFAKESNSKGKNKNNEKVLYLEKVKITDIDNEFVIIVDEKPSEVGVDPYYKLIDTKSYDNRRGI